MASNTKATNEKRDARDLKKKEVRAKKTRKFLRKLEQTGRLFNQ